MRCKDNSTIREIKKKNFASICKRSVFKQRKNTKQKRRIDGFFPSNCKSIENVASKGRENRRMLGIGGNDERNEICPADLRVVLRIELGIERLHIQLNGRRE